MKTGVIKRLLPMGLSYLASGGSLLISAAAQLITFAILARTMGTSQFAVYVTISAFTNVGTQICGLGSQESMVRRVARELSFYPVMFGHVMLLTLGTGVLLVLAGIFALPFMISLPPSEMPSLMAIGLLLITNILLVKLIGVATAAYIAHSNFAVANSPNAVILHRPKYGNFSPEQPNEKASFLHFFGTHRYKGDFFARRGQEVIKALNSAASTPRMSADASRS